MSIGSNIRKIRKEKSMTQAEFAHQVGISRTYLSDLENDRKSPSFDTLQALSDKIGVSMPYLVENNLSGFMPTIENEFDSLMNEISQNQDFYDEETIENFINFSELSQQITPSNLTYIESQYLNNSLEFFNHSRSERDGIILFLINNVLETTMNNIQYVTLDTTQEEKIKRYNNLEQSAEKLVKYIKNLNYLDK